MMINMALSYRIIYWIPTTFFFILNMLLKLIIFLLQHIGNALVWTNRQIIKAGNWSTDKAQDDEEIDRFIEKIQRTKDETKNRVEQKRNRR